MCAKAPEILSKKIFASQKKLSPPFPAIYLMDCSVAWKRGERYILLVRWDSLEVHTIGFRQSPQYQEWERLLHHYYDPFPTVEHYKKV